VKSRAHSALNKGHHALAEQHNASHLGSHNSSCIKVISDEADLNSSLATSRAVEPRQATYAYRNRRGCTALLRPYEPSARADTINPARDPAANFARHRGLTLAHIIPAVFYITLLPLQFINHLRLRFPCLHRWNGRVLVGLGDCVAMTALVMSFIMAKVARAGGVGRPRLNINHHIRLPAYLRKIS
jgi:hypothetical protein